MLFPTRSRGRRPHKTFVCNHRQSSVGLSSQLHWFFASNRQHGTNKHSDWFFWTPHYFANGPHIVALTQLRASKTGSKICCTQSTIHIFWILSELGFRGYFPRKIFPLKIFGYGVIYKKVPFFTDFCVLKQKHRKNCECCPGHYLSTSAY